MQTKKNSDIIAGTLSNFLFKAYANISDIFQIEIS